jgi:Reverse transcriptase (RNA-dependent DNA polymerase)
MTEVLQSIGFCPSPADPCLFVKKQVKGEPPVFIILYVDDGGIIGTPAKINQVLLSLSKVLTVKDLGAMKHFVGSHLIENASGNTIWVHQPKLIRHLEEKFTSFMEIERVYKTPAAPKTVIM